MNDQPKNEANVISMEGTYMVRSEDGKSWYMADLNKRQCNCRWWRERPMAACRHLRLAEEYRNRGAGGGEVPTRDPNETLH
jgi:hypothetical protein